MVLSCHLHFIFVVLLSSLGPSRLQIMMVIYWDPLEVFCGSRDCYSLLGVENDANSTTISKAYRKISRATHPDKVRDPSQKANATEQFRIVAKAYEILIGNETRPNYDYYLEHGSRSYYRFADGRGVWKALPKDPCLVCHTSCFRPSVMVLAYSANAKAQTRSKFT